MPLLSSSSRHRIVACCFRNHDDQCMHSVLAARDRARVVHWPWTRVYHGPCRCHTASVLRRMKSSIIEVAVCGSSFGGTYCVETAATKDRVRMDNACRRPHQVLILDISHASSPDAKAEALSRRFYGVQRNNTLAVLYSHVLRLCWLLGSRLLQFIVCH